jgi:hypothetical protein
MNFRTCSAVALFATLSCGAEESADAPMKDAGGSVDASADVSAGDAAEPTDAGGESDVIEVADGGTVSDAAPLTPEPGKWTYYTIPGTQCLDGTAAGFGLSTSPASDDLMIYFEGGGACFNDACDFTAFSLPFIPPLDGIFSRIHPSNAVRNWNMIYVPYCSGDIHAGDKDYPLAGKTRHFRGYSNVTRFLDYWVVSLPWVKRVLSTGISAGGFGAGLNAKQIVEAFGPSLQYILLDDSGPPLSKAAMTPCLQARFTEVWGLDQTFLASCGSECTHPDDFARDWIAHIANTYPNARAGIFSNTRDSVIRTFMGFGWGNGSYDNCSGTPTSVPADVYHQDLLDLKAQYSTRLSTYYVGPTRLLYGAGLWHTVLRSSTYYTTVIDGVSVSAWVANLISGKLEHVGP